MADKIRFKRGLKANLPVLDEGEPGFCTDTKELFIGTASGNVLVGVVSGGGGGSAPANVTNLTATPSSTSVALSWAASSGATDYEIWRNGSLLTTITGTTYNATSLASNTQYTFMIKAKNTYGTASGTSVTTTTTSAGTVPADVTNLAATTTANSVDLTWTASASATSYLVFKDSVQVDEITGTAYVAYGLTTGTQYTFMVRAKNAAGTSTGVSVNATPTAAATPSETVYASDTFTRADSTTTMGNDETGKTWTAYTAQTWGISSNQAYSPVFDLNDPIYIDAGQSDNLYYEVRIPVIHTSVQIMWRITGKDDYYVLDAGTVYRVVADVWSSKGTVPVFVNGDLLRVELRGSEHKIFINGVLRLTFSDSAHQTSTRFGFASGSTTPRFDNFKVASLVEGGGGTTVTNNETATVWVGGVE